MKYVLILIFLILQATAYGQNPGVPARLLEPLEWNVVNCGRTEFGPQQRCKLTIVNNTNQFLQGYWLNWYAQAVKVNFAQIDPISSKTIDISTNEYWVFTDENLNAIGPYEPLNSTNKIIVNPSDFEVSKKLRRPITDNSLPGTPSGGERLKEQTAYDVLKYDLSIEILPDDKFIKGSNTITVKALDDLEHFVFDLDTLLKVNQASLLENEILTPLSTTFQDGKYWSRLPEKIKKGEILNVAVEYSGHPREATHAPYQGGFSWNRTKSCKPWIASSCQVDGADLWFPCKDYQWDEPDSADLSFTVPKGLQAISNGILVDSTDTKNGTITFHWKVKSPINNYAIAINIAPYKHIPDTLVNTHRDSLNVSYWVLPENFDTAKAFYANSKDYIRFLESVLGPYPFRKEKFGIVEVPFVAMEHQTIIAMGPKYEYKYPGYNSILFHEIGHEWFGNMVTALDWNDYWLQESLVGYMEALYEEKLQGQSAYSMKIESFRKGLKNSVPLAPKYITNSREIYSSDSYKKGAFLIHTLRYLIGKEKLSRVLRLMAYPNKPIESFSDGSYCRFSTTNEFFEILEEVSEQDFDWFEETYFRSAALPKLVLEENSSGTQLHWVTTNGYEFKMPLELETNVGILKVDFVDNSFTSNLSRSEIISIDPNGWVLFELEDKTRGNKR